MKSKISSKIEDYENQGLIKKGGFGDVAKICLASDKTQIYANKIIKLDIFLEEAESNKKCEELVKEFENELVILERLSKEIIKPRSFPKFYGVIIEKSSGSYQTFNILFEYQPYSLKDIINDCQNYHVLLEFRLVYNYLISLLFTCAFLQCKGICHRDIKPPNVLIDASKEFATLIDFGLARITRDRIKLNQSRLPSKIDLHFEGTIPYMAPELLINVNNDVDLLNYNAYKADVFSYGLMGVEIWTLLKIDNQNNVENNIINAINNIKNNQNTVHNNQRNQYHMLVEILEKCLIVNKNNRPDFVTLFRDYFMKFSDPIKIRYHIIIQERDLEENSSNSILKALDKSKYNLYFNEKFLLF